eukprot:12965408-Alexandrium_andersonii.AAC.1
MPPGHSVAAEMFRASFRRVVVQWLSETEDCAVLACTPWLEYDTDVGTTVYADDIGRQYSTRGAGEVHKKVVQTDHSLDACLTPA